METTLTPFEALKACLAKAGTQQAMGDDLGCSQTAIWKMIQVRRMSTPFVLTAERLYGVSRHDLRPDIYPRPMMIDQASSLRETMVDGDTASRFAGIDRDAGGRMNLTDRRYPERIQNRDAA